MRLVCSVRFAILILASFATLAFGALALVTVPAPAPKNAQEVTGGVVSLRGPIVGVWSQTVVYMDPAVSARTWTAQSNFSRIALAGLIVVILCLGVRTGKSGHCPTMNSTAACHG